MEDLAKIVIGTIVAGPNGGTLATVISGIFGGD